MKKFLKPSNIALLLFFWVLAACTSTPTVSIEITETPFAGNIIFTAAAQTVEAELTRVSNTNETPTVPTLVTIPTQTFSITPSLPPNVRCDNATFVLDVSYPDGSKLEPGEIFIKTWRIKNSGTCIWNSTYSVVFENGSAMNASASYPLTNGEVEPGEEIDISIEMKAPSFPGLYRGEWKLRNSLGQIFGVGNSSSPFWVEIEVISQ